MKEGDAVIISNRKELFYIVALEYNQNFAMCRRFDCDEVMHARFSPLIEHKENCVFVDMVGRRWNVSTTDILFRPATINEVINELCRVIANG